MRISLISPVQKRGFTLLEILLAMGILGVMSLMIFGSFYSIMTATREAENALDEVHLSSTLLSQVSTSLRSSVFDGSQPENFEFFHEDADRDYPADIISWVTPSSLLLPADYPTPGTATRIELTIAEVDGETGLAVRAYSSAWKRDDPDAEDVEPQLISTLVKGLDVVMYDVSENDWVEEWERSRQVPAAVIITLTIQNPNDERDMITVRKLVNIPIAKLSRAQRRGERRVELSR